MDMKCNTFEMTDAQLEAVYGGGGAPLGLGLGGVGAGFSTSQAAEARIHSFSGFCDTNIFSNNVISSVLKGVLNIANSNTQICANND